MKFKILLTVWCLITSTFYAINVTTTYANAVIRGELTPAYRLVITDYDTATDPGLTITLNVNPASTVKFGDDPGHVQFVSVYRNVFDPTDESQNRIKSVNAQAGANNSLIINNITSNVDDFELLIAVDLDSDVGLTPVSLFNTTVSVQEGAGGVSTSLASTIPVAYFDISSPTTCSADGSIGSGVIANSFSLVNFALDTPFIINNQTDSIPVMVLEIESVGAPLELREVGINNHYDGQSQDERFQIDAESEGISTAELIRIASDDPCALSDGTRNFLKTELYRPLGNLSSLDSDLTNNFDSDSRLVSKFSGDHVQEAGSAISIPSDDSEFFLISYKLCSTCTALDLSGDERFIISTRLPQESVKGRYQISLGDPDVSYFIETKNYTTAAPNNTGRSFQELISLNFVEDSYEGLVSRNHVFSPGTQAEIFKMEIKPQGIIDPLDASLDTLQLRKTVGDFTQLAELTVYTDEALQNRVSTVTDFTNANQIQVNLHAPGDPTDAGLDIEADTQLFVAARFKQDADEGTYDAFVLSGTGSIDGNTVNFIGALNTTPNVTATTTATVEISAQTVSVTEMDIAIRPARAIEGMLFVPVLWFELSSSTQLDDETMKIKNSFNLFNDQNHGISRVSVFKDVNDNKQLDLGTDLLISSKVPTPNSTEMASDIELDGVSIPSGLSQYIVTYDIGREVAASSQVNALFDGLASRSVAGVLPGPSGGDNLVIIDNEFTITSITATDAQGDVVEVVGPGNTEFINYNIGINNGFDQSVEIVNAFPVSFKDNISGLNISQQFTIGNDALLGTTHTAISEENPFTVEQGASRTFSYDITVPNLVSSGQVIMDSLVTFRVPEASRGLGDFVGIDGSLISLFRFRSDSSSFKSSAGLTPSQISTAGNNQIVVFNTTGTPLNQQFNFEFPGYVDSVLVSRSNQEVAFQNFHPLTAGESIIINFNSPEQIDLSSARIVLNETNSSQVLSRSTELTSTPYFDIVSAGTGEASLQIHNIQSDINGANTIKISLSDIAGTALDDINLSFFMSETIIVDQFYFFPNPYSPNIISNGANVDLQFGFSVTHQPSSVDLYIISSTGRLVADLNYDVTNPQFNLTTNGYKRLSTNLQNKLSPGIYIAKLIVKDGSGREVSKVTKFAVY